MSIPKKSADLVPQGEMKTFMDELGRVTDRDSFNSLMKRFDDSFLQRYSSKPAPSELRPQIQSIPPESLQRRPAVPSSYNPASQYSQYPIYPVVQTEIQRVSSEGRYPRGGQEFFPSHMKYYQEEPADYYQVRQDNFEDPYRVPMFQRLPQTSHESPYISQPPQGYIRTDYISQPPNPYQPFGSSKNLSARNPLQESMDLRRVKEEMLFQAKPEIKPLENMTLPPARYDKPSYDPQPGYFQSNFKSYYSGN